MEGVWESDEKVKTPIELLDETLLSLKDFQRATVRATMLNYEGNGSQRVLVADEVGLGKTIVAKGVIAELLKKHLQQQSSVTNKRLFRVTYICSNLTLANENRTKLAVFKGESEDKYVQKPSYQRLLEIAVKQNASSSDEKILELCSLTPSTSFNLSSGHGNWHERLIAYFALIESVALTPYEQKLSEFLSNGVGNWADGKENFIRLSCLDKEIVEGFHKILNEYPKDVEKEYIGVDSSYKSWLDILLAFCRDEITFEESYLKSRFRTYIRSLLARACAKHLSADLFILDEFQRFKSLLDTTVDNDESLVANEVFHNKKKTKVLLLSATPFKALSHAEEDEKGNAHSEELNFLLNFISNSDKEMLEEYEQYRHDIQQQILSLRSDSVSTDNLDNKNKVALERILSKYICRTERAQISEEYKNLFSPVEKEGKDNDCIKDFTKQEVDAFIAIDQLGLGLQQLGKNRSGSQLMEFYKATPWPLSFLTGYQFKKQLDEHLANKTIRSLLRKSKPAWLSSEAIQGYQVDLGNAPHAKTRALIRKVFETSSEELLWIPPSLPHYPLQGSFEKQENFSKTLLFSSWAMVPRALSGLISYEAERRLLLNRRVDKAYHKDGTHSPKIRFDSDASLSGWSLVYPSKIMLDMPWMAGMTSLSQLVEDRTAEFKIRLVELSEFEKPARISDRWYALAPMLLDKKSGHSHYLQTWLDKLKKSNNSGEAGREKLSSFLADENLQLGPMPEDFAQYLAYLSIASPAVCIARTWHRNWSNELVEDVAYAATQSAFAAVTMFNKPESESILSKLYKKQKSFLSIVRYSADGGFQAVIDEFGHLLKDAGLPMVDSKNDNAYSATTRLIDVLEFKTTSVACQFYEAKNETSDRIIKEAENLSKKHTLRCHYAVPLGNQKTSDEVGVQRVSAVRDAFNSPFRPFMLNSTSIGQEGLDFHWYCHRVVHWNIPSNPIDIEQREGRVNRYKSLVVRKRIAQKYGSIVDFNNEDPWESLFHQVDFITKENGRKSDLVPYWHLPEGNAKIERFVPMMPMSKDMAKFSDALEILSLYRLAFGQPRQEELLENLLKRKFSNEEIEQIKSALVINLSPMIRLPVFNV